MCINVCNYFKSRTTRFNAALFGIRNSTLPRFDEEELIKQGILQELFDTVEVRVIVHSNNAHILLHCCDVVAHSLVLFFFDSFIVTFYWGVTAL